MRVISTTVSFQGIQYPFTAWLNPNEGFIRYSIGDIIFAQACRYGGAGQWLMKNGHPEMDKNVLAILENNF